MNPKARRLSTIVSLLCFTATSGEWTRFRGPNGTGVSEDKGIPTVWTEQSYNWRTEMPGPGHSSPAVWNGKVFLLTGDEGTNKLWVLCVSATEGRILWQKDFPLSAYRKNAFNTLASGSPAVDAERVYCSWSIPERVTVIAFDHKGAQVWERDLGRYRSQHGPGTSPMLYGGRVILANEQDGESFIIALDAASGETRWKTARKSGRAVYATPCVYERGGQAQLIFTSQAHGVYALELNSGSVLWEMPGLFDKRIVSSPLVAGELVVAACGAGEGGNYLVAVRPGSSDGSRKPEVAYKIDRSAPYVPTSVYRDGLLFLWSDNGVVSCLRAESGKVLWQERLGKNFFSSPVWVDGRLFCVSSPGDVMVVRAGEKFELLATNVLGERVHSTPAVSGGRMYIHTVKHLISVGGKAAP
jgi:outer membrane protein assembly factor BamB